MLSQTPKNLFSVPFFWVTLSLIGTYNTDIATT